MPVKTRQTAREPIVSKIKYQFWAEVSAVMTNVLIRRGSMRYMPRPCVAAIRLSPSQNRPSTEQLVGPWLAGDQVVPESSLANRPTSVPA